MDMSIRILIILTGTWLGESQKSSAVNCLTKENRPNDFRGLLIFINIMVSQASSSNADLKERQHINESLSPMEGCQATSIKIILENFMGRLKKSSPEENPTRQVNLANFDGKVHKRARSRLKNRPSDSL